MAVYVDAPRHRVGKKAAGRSLDGQQWNEVPRGPLEGGTDGRN